MLSKHGTLESAILCALWQLEGRGIYTNSVKDVFNYLNNNDKENTNARAYTTVKTVMDRLVQKNVLLRFKQGNKFNYRTAYSNNEIIISSLTEIANRYCNGNLEMLSIIIKNMNNNQELINA